MYLYRTYALQDTNGSEKAHVTEHFPTALFETQLNSTLSGLDIIMVLSIIQTIVW
jgi:hypothetical protein